MHRRKRRVLAQGLSEDALQKFEPTLLSCLASFCDKLAEDQSPSDGGWTVPKNMTDWCESMHYREPT